MKRLLTEASLIMKPEGQADGLLPSVKPINGSGDFTFSRGSNLAATRVNQAGLIEKGRENLLLQSNQFDTGWPTSNASFTSGQSGYDGSNNAWLLTASLAGGRIQLSRSDTGVNTTSAYFKKGSADGVWLRVDMSGTDANVYVNLIDGSEINSTGEISTKINDVGNGWYRVALTANWINVINIRIYPTNTGGVAVAGSIYIQDAQLEVGLAATSYIPTTATTAKVGILEDTPRLDYSGGATEPSLLLEPQRSNLITYSEYLNGSIWSHNSSTATINADVSPSGHNDATSLYISLANAAVFSRAYFTNVANSTHIGSVFLKKVEGAEVRLRVSGGAASLEASAIFNLDNGTYRDAVGSVTPSIESVGNGWYRCSIGDLSGSGIASPSFRIDTLGAQNDTTVLVWGAVVEVGTYPTSYIPTNGSAVTRGADSCYKINASDVIGQSEGTMFIDFVYTKGVIDNRFSISSNDAINWVFIGTPESGHNNSSRFYIRVNNIVVVDVGTSSYFTDGQRYKLALAYQSGNWAVYGNGVQLYSGSDTIPSFTSSVDTINFKSFISTASVTEKESVNQALLFKERLSNAELAALTTL